MELNEGYNSEMRKSQVHIETGKFGSLFISRPISNLNLLKSEDIVLVVEWWELVAMVQCYSPDYVDVILTLL